MGAQNHAGSEMPFAQFVFNSDVFGRKLTEEQQRSWVDFTAARFAVVFEEAAHEAEKAGTSRWAEHQVDVQVFRSRGVRGKEREATLPPGDLWGVQLFLRPKPLLPAI